jgi:hypothetical protein
MGQLNSKIDIERLEKGWNLEVPFWDLFFDMSKWGGRVGGPLYPVCTYCKGIWKS